MEEVFFWDMLYVQHGALDLFLVFFFNGSSEKKMFFMIAIAFVGT